AANHAIPQVAARRPLRRSNQTGVTSLIVGLILIALVGVGGIYAYRASQPTAARPNEAPHERPITPKPAETEKPGQPKETKLGQAGKTNAAATKERRAWFYTRSPEGSRGLIYHVSGKRWVEKTSDGRTNEFVQQEITDHAASLAD